jgi:hypothetical protein
MSNANEPQHLIRIDGAVFYSVAQALAETSKTDGALEVWELRKSRNDRLAAYQERALVKLGMDANKIERMNYDLAKLYFAQLGLIVERVQERGRYGKSLPKITTTAETPMWVKERLSNG